MWFYKVSKKIAYPHGYAITHKLIAHKNDGSH